MTPRVVSSRSSWKPSPSSSNVMAASCEIDKARTTAGPLLDRRRRPNTTGRRRSGAHSVSKRILMAVTALAYLAAWPASALAQEWPQRPIRIIVAFGAGGGADIISRILGQPMQEKLGQAVVIENRPGAGGTIGNEAVARADKDGYTLGIMTAGQIIAATTKKTLRYD